MFMIGGPNFTKNYNKLEPFMLDMYVFLAMPCGPKNKNLKIMKIYLLHHFKI
jgi:hypothetical protein